MAFTNQVRNNVLDAVNGVAAFQAPVTPLRVRLMTVNGTTTAAGTELATGAGGGSGPGYTAGGQAVSFPAAADGAVSPTATLRWDNMPATTIVGGEIWDSAATPKRWQFAALTEAKTLASGDAFELPLSDFDMTLV
ncbi:MAG: hypothetical protein M3N52_11755 [Actinomycetota bacterium]|nr:hypothetical protein [Actinomycetota bacterium]